MHAQLERLLQLSEQSNITLQVFRYEAGALPASTNKFIIVSFNSPDIPSVVFIEGLHDDLYVEDPGDVEIYNATFRRLSEMAASPDQTREIIAQMILRYRG